MNEQAKFTPGPWQHYQNPSGSVGIASLSQKSGDGRQSNVGYVSTSYPLRNQIKANANLISSAPELYEALKGLLSPHGGVHATPELIEAAHTAVNKAEGRTHDQ